MQFIRRYCFTTICLFAINSLFPVLAADNVDTSYDIPHRKMSAVIDGELNDEIWQHATIISLDIVNSPWNNQPSPVRTTAKLVENGDILYIAFIAQDPEPDQIKASLGDRDSRLSDDFVGIKLDTFNNRRLNYEFLVNPLGVQIDGINNVMTGESNRAWDGMWEAYGKITDQGYQVEMAIPYYILNFEDTSETKQWAFELIRVYPRDTALRISHQLLDRNNDCWLCQSPTMTGFKHAKASKNIMLTPTLVASKNDTRNIYNPGADWHGDEDVEAGLDIRWGINSNNLLNATINPDFSTVETDAGQLSVNKTYSLYYEEKRPFFLDNADYFSSNFNLVYTRNIADPDYGAKLTGTQGSHSYGIFVTNDSETNFLMPGNTSSDIAQLNEESHSTALRYRFDVNEDLSIGAVSTLRKADNYHNYLVGIDSKYRFDDSNTFKGQLLSSNTEYPKALYQSFCYGDSTDSCDNQEQLMCSFGQCPYNEQVHRAKKDGEFSDQAVKLSYEHKSEYWEFGAQHQQIGGDFRADLGFIERVDVETQHLGVERLFYGDVDSPWQEAAMSVEWKIDHNENGELINKAWQGMFSIDGPLQSYVELLYVYSDKIGLRHDETNLAIDGNSSRFNEKYLAIYGSIEATNQLSLAAEIKFGNKIDYKNNRLGDYQELYASITYNVNKHLSAEFSFTQAELEAGGSDVYTANLAELRLAYQFDVYSYLKLNIVYDEVDQNVNNNPHAWVSSKNKNLSTQLIYAYKLNPQTVFYLGYSDNSYQDDDIDDLKRDQRTFFTKLSYAWLP